MISYLVLHMGIGTNPGEGESWDGHANAAVLPQHGVGVRVGPRTGGGCRGAPYLYFCAPKQSYVIINDPLPGNPYVNCKPIPERMKVGMVTLTLPSCHNMESGSELDPVPVVVAGEPTTCIFVPQKTS